MLLLINFQYRNIVEMQDYLPSMPYFILLFVNLLLRLTALIYQFSVK